MRFVVAILIALGVLVPGPVHAQSVTAKFLTTPPGGNYAPRNVTVVWVEDSGGTFVKTIARWANQRKQYLISWVAKAGPNDADAVTSATRQDHTLQIMAIWDLKDKNGNVIPDGTYTIRMETADADVTTASMNHQGTFTFVKGPTPQVQSNLSNGGFAVASITYSTAAACGNSILDPGETCDPPGSCPTSCVDSGDACSPNVLVGLASSCTAQCQQQLVTACHDNDGCCPVGCTGATDSDCPGGSNADGAATGSDSTNAVQGGCSTTPGSSWLVFAVVAGALVLRRRKRA
ncbi:hypothetical protein BH11MYX1_BH11MYX1_03100 [soil metagenome]